LKINLKYFMFLFIIFLFEFTKNFKPNFMYFNKLGVIIYFILKRFS